MPTEGNGDLDSDLCPCGETLTMSHIVESCPLTKLNGGLSRLHSGWRCCFMADQLRLMTRIWKEEEDLLTHLSAHLYHHHSHNPSLLHSFTSGSKCTFSTNPSNLRLLSPTKLASWRWDWTGPIMLIGLHVVLVSHFFRTMLCTAWYMPACGVRPSVCHVRKLRQNE